MGVHGLWELLSPVGRRVSVDTLAGKRLAIDASIWMVQFMKAMRDEKGDMVRNAHVLGFFRRICKLLFLRTKPVFVFDGATPELKRRTVASRRRHRDAAQAKVRKTAEKLLLNHLKAMRLQEIADNIKNQRQEQKSGAKGKKKVSPNPSSLIGNISGKNDMSSDNRNREKLDEMLAESVMVEEEDEKLANTLAANEEDGDEDEDEEMILPDMSGEVDPTVLAALTPSLRLDLLQKQKLKSDAKGKKIQSDKVERNIEMGETGASSSNQQRLDEMLAASLMEEERRAFTNNALTSSALKAIEEDGNMDANDEEDEDEDEEMIVPPMDGEVDPSILASLPPSMQLDLLVQIRERLMAENRQKYQKVKKNPEKFSELQIQSYLKTVAFRREINQVQKAASGRGVAGVQTSRIASESNREFIFSSSFSGNKQVLASGRTKEFGDKQQISEEQSSIPAPTVASTSKSNPVTGSEEHTTSTVHTATPTSQSNTVTESELDGSRRGFDDSIETYVDEQGRVRVSRVRAMGICMSRDLQRNLELMKEIEEENVNVSQSKRYSAVPTSSPSNVVTGTLPNDAEAVKLSNTEENAALNGGTAIEISFGDDGDTTKCFDDDDDLFTRLVSENPGGPDSDNIMPLDNNLSAGSDSDCDWEEGSIEAKRNTLSGDANLDSKHPFAEVDLGDGSEVEWEEEDREASEHTITPLVAEKSERNSKGYLEEEADIEEAIRRSLGDEEEQRSEYAMPENDELELPVSNTCESKGIPESKLRTEEPIFRGDGGIKQNISITEILDGVKPGFSETADSPKKPLNQSMACNPDETTTSLVSYPKRLMQDASKSANLFEELPRVESQLEEFRSLGSTNPPALPFTEEEMVEFIHEIDNEEKLSAKQNENIFLPEVEHVLENSGLEMDANWHVEAAEANLREEMKILNQERLILGDERRQLERNAESVSGEMFIDCQELLQMFGIPYIISPTEAESQCAFLEIANLVDGVVTDDSDAFLFGAQSVYKNIFDDRKYVETYFMKDIEDELGLSRDKLISMALLLGSDYTEGVSGIGIVNAIEVLNAFPEECGLKEFRDWIESPDPTILGKHDDQLDSKARKKGSNAGNNDSCSQSNTTEVSSLPENSADEIHKRKNTFMDKHRKVSKNWHVPTSFPSQTVISAYLSPLVDKSADGFSWGKPDHFLLRKLCWEKFGWDSHKADEMILPVLKEYNKRETQLRLEAFYTFNEPFAKFRSKRIKKAVKGITGKKSLKLDDPVSEVSVDKDKRKSTQTESGDNQSENATEHEKKLTAKKPRKRTKLGADVSEYPNLSDGVQGSNKRSQPSRRGRGRGKRKGKGILAREVSETSSSDSEEEARMETPKEHVDLRRSGRARRPVVYTANDLETDDLNRSADSEDDKEVDKETRNTCEHSQEQEEHNITESISPKPIFKTDHLELGGGFCVDEGDNDDKLEAEEGYLRSGGGFCVGEDETNPDENSPLEEATPLAEENADLDKAVLGVSQPILDRLLPENDSQTIPVGALHSMPRLRKKRRKG